jgi:diguanylate cyclase (GGDEF)-like protein
VNEPGANTDKLTGLPDRRHLLEALEREVSQRRCADIPLALLVLDIDDLKRFNDYFGHESGDDLLVQVAERLLDAVGSTDIACRVGGDEFAIIFFLPGADDPEVLLARLSAEVAQIPERLNPGHPKAEPLRIKGGIAWFQAGDDAIALLQRAETELYRR